MKIVFKLAYKKTARMSSFFVSLAGYYMGYSHILEKVFKWF